MIRTTRFILILTFFMSGVLFSCGNQGGEENVLNPADSITATPEATNEDTIAADTVVAVEPEPVKEPAKKQTVTTPNNGKRETLYISTYGANGKVWGHVTMNGSTGRGTIHDEGENSYSITVTRHGNELYGTDQNGRQYVFRL
ncbi:MAG: hypothetical protein J5848_03470 [Bacteroidales bacterium]|nr:hypothetical protein [Bacteroidales bacterium]